MGKAWGAQGSSGGGGRQEAPGRYTQAAISPGTGLTSGHLVEDAPVSALGPCQASTPELVTGAWTWPLCSQPERPSWGDIPWSSTQPCWPPSPGLALPLCPGSGIPHTPLHPDKGCLLYGGRREPSRCPAQSSPTLASSSPRQVPSGWLCPWGILSFHSQPLPGPGGPGCSPSPSMAYVPHLVGTLAV